MFFTYLYSLAIQFGYDKVISKHIIIYKQWFIALILMPPVSHVTPYLIVKQIIADS